MAQNTSIIDQSLAPHEQALASRFAQLGLEKNQPQISGIPPAAAGGPGHGNEMTRGGQTKGFEPMRAVTAQDNQSTQAPHEQAILRFAREFNDIPSNYRGDPLNTSNSGADVKDEENTAIWLTGLPINCTHKMLLEAIAHCKPGKVYSTYINAANPTANLPRRAAKVVFFSRAGAENCFKAIKERKIVVGGRYPHVVWNRHKSAAQLNTSRSRVVLIRGPSELVRRDVLDRWFSQKFKYQTEDVLVRRVPQPGVTVLEWRFGSFKAQAEAATMFMSENELDGTKLEWRWGLDPCA